MTTPALLLFDLGGVLIENATFTRLNQLLHPPLPLTTLKNCWLTSDAVRQFELGQISPDDFANAFIAEWQIQLDPAAFLSEFTSWPSGFYPQAREALHALRGKFRVGCLSNSNVLHWKRFGSFADEFDIALSSHQLGAIKPDANAFVRAFEACGCEPSAVCFFDDQFSNVQTAQTLGACAFHVDGIAALLHTLRDEGLLSD